MHYRTLCIAGRDGHRLSRTIVSALLGILLLCGSYHQASGQSLQLLSPNGGEVLTGDTVINVQWMATEFDPKDDVEVEYTLDGGSRWRGIGKTEANTGTISWRVPNKPSENVLVRVMSRDGSASDQSDALLAIIENPLDVTLMISPNGGEVWTEGETHAIEWQAPLDAVDVTLELSVDFGFTWSELATVPAQSAPWQWQIPHLSDEEIAAAAIRVTVTEAPDHFDQSDAPFTIRPLTVVKQPSITLLYPNGGEVLAVDSTIAISWTSENVIGQAEAQYSVDEGVTWQKIDRTDISSGTLEWKVPNEPAVRAAIRIIMADGSVEDRSDIPFTITERDLLPVILLTPNGGEIWTEGETRTIEWQAPQDMTNALLEYSPDGGITWQDIATVPAATGSFNWVLPHISDTDAPSMIVSISDPANPVRRARSADHFTIRAKQIASSSPDLVQPFIANKETAFPTPAHNTVTLRWEQETTGRATIHIHGLDGVLALGREYTAASPGKQHLLLPLHDTPAGTYVYTIQTPDSRLSGTLLITR